MKNIYKRHRFPPSIIHNAVWLYYRLNLSIRDVEDLPAERSINVSYESIHPASNRFGSEFARRLKRKHLGFGDTCYLDEVFVKIRGKRHHLWRAVDQDGEVVDVYLHERRDANAAKRLSQRFLENHAAVCGIRDKSSLDLRHLERLVQTLPDFLQRFLQRLCDVGVWIAVSNPCQLQLEAGIAVQSFESLC
jgi:transposase-like protein